MTKKKPADQCVACDTALEPEELAVIMKGPKITRILLCPCCTHRWSVTEARKD